MKIKVCDCIMGGGKTSAAINQMNSDKENNYIFITPYLDEVDKIKKECAARSFVSPQNKGKGKLDSLHYHLGRNENIASTHALFKSYNDYTLELIKNGEYTLILDEVFDVVEKLDIHKDDLKLLLDQNIIKVEGEHVIWVDDSYDGEFVPLKEIVQTNNIICYKNHLLLWTFPIEVFESFKDVIVLTYLFDAQIQKYYYDMNSVEIEYIGTKYENQKYVFTDQPQIPDSVNQLKNKIHILYDKKLNLIGDNKTALSVSWFTREAEKRQKPFIKIIKNNLTNVFINRYKSPSNLNMWTTFKQFKGQLSGKSYTTGFLSYNIRSTNQYRHKNHLAYCANVYFNPFLKNYFLNKGIEGKEDKYALSELIQWIWRSAIRDGKEIWIYIPSRRMRELLEDWLAGLSTKETTEQ